MRPHVQRLELDYILFRGAALSEALSKAARAVVRPIGLGRAQAPYWLGQTFVAARRAAAPATAGLSDQGASRTS